MNTPRFKFALGFGKKVGVTGGVRIVSIGITFLFFLVLSREMSTVDFGVFSIVYALATIVSYVANFGQHVAVLRFWPAVDQHHGSATASAVLRIGATLTLTGGGLICLLLALSGVVPVVLQAFGGKPEYLVWAGLMAFVFALAEFAASALRAKEILLLAFVPRDIIWRLTVIILIFAAFPNLDASGALSLTTIALFVSCLPQFLVLALDVWRHRKASLPLAESQMLLRATPTFWASSGITPIMDNGTTVLVGIALGPIEAGAYFAADRLAKLLLVALVGIEQVAAPQLARSFHTGKLAEVKQLTFFASVVAFACAVVGGAAYLILGKTALSLFNTEFTSAYPVLLILALGQIANALCGVNALLLDMAGQERNLLLIRFASGLLAVGLGFWAAFNFGSVGAAVASSIVMVGWNLAAVAICRWRLGIWTIFFAAALFAKPFEKEPSI